MIGMWRKIMPPGAESAAAPADLPRGTSGRQRKAALLAWKGSMHLGIFVLPYGVRVMPEAAQRRCAHVSSAGKR